MPFQSQIEALKVEKRLLQVISFRICLFFIFSTQVKNRKKQKQA